MAVLAGLAEAIVDKEQEEERRDHPEDERPRRGEIAIGSGRDIPESDRLGKEGQNDANKSAGDEEAHHKEPPEKISTWIGDMQIEEMAIDRRQYHQEHNEARGLGVDRQSKETGGQHRHKRQRDIDVDQNIDKLPATEDKTEHQTDANEK